MRERKREEKKCRKRQKEKLWSKIFQKRLGAINNSGAMLVYRIPLGLLLLAWLSATPSAAVSNRTATRLLQPRSGHPDAALVDSSEDYDKVNDDPVSPSPPGRRSTPPTQRCDYNPCQDRQGPCSQLAATMGCLCPGVSGQNVPPEAPFLRGLSWEAGRVVVRWCAPSSAVTRYRVLVDGAEVAATDGDRRAAELGAVGVRAEVCVEALNEAGASAEGGHSCRRYEPQGDSGLALKVGLIGGALGLLLLLSLAVLLWRLRTRRKAGARISTHGTEGPL